MNDFGKPIGLLTRDELALELMNRTDGPALVILGEEGGTGLQCRHSFAAHRSIPEMLRMLADDFEAGNNGEDVPEPSRSE